MREGVFDVVIGNPPYVVNSAQKIPYDLSMSGLNTLAAGNLYAYVFERSIQVAKKGAPISLIIQLTAISSGRMQSLQDLLVGRGLLLVLPYPPDVRRITRKTALARNRLVLALASESVIPFVADDSSLAILLANADGERRWARRKG